jgi:tRNA (guanine37-N1)-methyltransferase
MVIKPGIIDKALGHCEKKWGVGFKIFFSPQGKRLDQRLFRKLAKTINLNSSKITVEKKHTSSKSHIILVCSRYEGMDARVEKEYADEILSIGDYVLMGGDLPAQVFLEGILRLLPGVVGKEESVHRESFESPFLDYPTYGLPVKWKDQTIPDVVLSGNHAEIEKWRDEQALQKTIRRRFDWFSSWPLTKEEKKNGLKSIPPHYIALMHDQVILGNGKEGVTSITSLDIHDSARSSSTYGIKKAFIVSPLKDQHSIMDTFLKFWRSEEGMRYNKTRCEAIRRIVPSHNFDEVIAEIEKKEGIKPIVIATSARFYSSDNVIDYSSHERVWHSGRPVLIVFGTGQGLSEEFMEKADFILIPVQGMTDYNHLSVRSAIAVVLDRWIGVHQKIDDASVT